MRKTKRKLCCSVNPVSASGKCKQCLIRSRKSYKDFRSRAKYITSVAKALIAIWAVVDSKRGWKSNYTSDCVHESINLLIEDMKLESIPCGILDPSA